LKEAVADAEGQILQEESPKHSGLPDLEHAKTAVPEQPDRLLVDVVAARRQSGNTTISFCY
jgi:hypothetical protein